jgi:predicted acylesterase/phospholipase RssA
MSSLWRPHAVSFSAGGVRSLGLAGVLAGLIETDVLSEVREWCGCSGGCFPAVFGAIGASPAWIRDAVGHLEMGPLIKVESDLVGAIGEKWGVSSGSGLLELFGRIVETWVPGFASWTFADFAREFPGVRLMFIATNVTQGSMTTFSVSETPAVRVMDALRASMTVPLFFTPTVINGEIFCDGAFCEYYPWSTVQASADKTLVVTCDERGIMGRPLPVGSPQSLTEYISRVFRISAAQRSGTLPRYWIALNDRVGFLDFKITREERVAFFDEGRGAAQRWLGIRGARPSSHRPMQLETPTASAAESRKPSQRPCDHPYTSQGIPVPSPDRTSGSHPPGTPSSRPYPYRSPHNESGRRWSL